MKSCSKSSTSRPKTLKIRKTRNHHQFKKSQILIILRSIQLSSIQLSFRDAWSVMYWMTWAGRRKAFWARQNKPSSSSRSRSMDHRQVRTLITMNPRAQHWRMQSQDFRRIRNNVEVRHCSPIDQKDFRPSGKCMQLMRKIHKQSNKRKTPLPRMSRQGQKHQSSTARWEPQMLKTLTRTKKITSSSNKLRLKSRN